MSLYLVRHAETTYNRDGLGLGRANPPLTDLGLRQTAAAVERLAVEKVDRIFTSPLDRATAIARPLAELTAATLEIRDELTEMDVGETEGLPYREMRGRFAAFLELWRAPDPSDATMPAGESLGRVAARLAPFADDCTPSPPTPRLSSFRTISCCGCSSAACSNSRCPRSAPSPSIWPRCHGSRCSSSSPFS